MSRKQPETRIVDHIKKELRSMGAEVIKIHGDEHTRTGEPDLVGCYQGHSFVIEVKQPGEEPRTSQYLKLWSWHLAGAYVGVADDVATARRIMQGESQHESVLRYLQDRGMEAPDRGI